MTAQNTIDFTKVGSLSVPVSAHFAFIQLWSSISCMSSTQISWIHKWPTSVSVFALFPSVMLMSKSWGLAVWNGTRDARHVYTVCGLYTFYFVWKTLNLRNLEPLFIPTAKASVPQLKKKKKQHKPDSLFRKWDIPPFFNDAASQEVRPLVWLVLMSTSDGHFTSHPPKKNETRPTKRRHRRRFEPVLWWSLLFFCPRRQEHVP